MSKDGRRYDETYSRDLNKLFGFVRMRSKIRIGRRSSAATTIGVDDIDELS